MAGVIAWLAAVLLVTLGSCAFNEAQCSSKAEKMGFKDDYGPVQGCMIHVDKAWIPIEQYRTLGNVD
jgi:hypothetical protein